MLHESLWYCAWYGPSEFLKTVKFNVRISKPVAGNVRFQLFLTLLYWPRHRPNPHLYKFRSRLLLLSLKEEIFDSELPLDPSLEWPTRTSIGK